MFVALGRDAEALGAHTMSPDPAVELAAQYHQFHAFYCRQPKTLGLLRRIEFIGVTPSKPATS